MNIVVYPKPTVLRYSGESSIEEYIDHSLIEPMIIHDVSVKAKKREWWSVLISDYLSSIRFDSLLSMLTYATLFCDIKNRMEEYRRKYLSPSYNRTSSYLDTLQKDKTVS